MNPRVHLIERHDEALTIWRRADVIDHVLIHIDAHHDMWRVPEDGQTTAANFIGAAISEGCFRRIFWVVPDGTFKNAASRRELKRLMASLLGSYPGNARRIESTDSSIAASVQGRSLTVCALQSLPNLSVPVVLDVDVDYFVVPRVAHNRVDDHRDRPWCWPTDVVAWLRRMEVQFDLATIAYSVEGSYTGLAWKYLGDELAARLATSPDETALAGYDALRAAVETDGGVDAVERSLSDASSRLPHSAAPDFHLALHYADLKNSGKARRHAARARTIDRSYATGFATHGPQYFWQGRYADAAAEFERALLLDPEDPHGNIGLGWLAAREKAWKEAIDRFQKALGISDDLLDAHRGLGEAYARLGDFDAAARHYERSLQLALHGHKPLSWHVLTGGTNDDLIDEDHCLSYGELAKVHARRGAIQKAIACYRISLAANSVSLGLRLEFARLLTQHGRWNEARAQVWTAFTEFPKTLKRQAKRFRRRLA